MGGALRLLRNGLLLSLLTGVPGVAAAETAPSCAALGPTARVTEQFSYRHREIQILQQDNAPPGELRVCVDGRLWPQDLLGRVGDGYSSRLLPFQEPTDLPALIKALLDNDGVLYQL